jgi:hypothetical protein
MLAPFLIFGSAAVLLGRAVWAWRHGARRSALLTGALVLLLLFVVRHEIPFGWGPGGRCTHFMALYEDRCPRGSAWEACARQEERYLEAKGTRLRTELGEMGCALGETFLRMEERPASRPD